MCGGKVVREEANVQSPPNSTHLRHLLTPIDTRLPIAVYTDISARCCSFLFDEQFYARGFDTHFAPNLHM